MDIVYKIDGVTLTHRVRFPGESTGFVTAAERGAVGTGGVIVEDPAGDLTISAWQVFTVDDMDATPNRVYTGYIGPRSHSRYKRFRTGAGRVHDLDLWDLNAELDFDILHSNSAKRPEESDVDRVTWLLGSEVLTPIPVTDEGLVSTSNPGNFLAADCRGSTAREVMAEMAPSAVKNFWTYRDPTAGAHGLFYDRDDSTAYESDLRISNVRTDVDDTTTFYPFLDATHERTPENQFGIVWYDWGNGSPLYVESASTIAAMGIRKAARYSTSRIGRLATAEQAAKDWLNVRAQEENTVTVTLRLPSAAVNGIQHGHRLEVKFSHLPGFEAFTWTRVQRKTITPDSEGFWLVRLQLFQIGTPTDDAALPTCGIVQQTSNQNGDAGNLTLTFPAPVTAGNTLVWVGRKRNSGGSGGLPTFMTVNTLIGRVVNWTVFDTAITLAGDILGPDMVKIGWVTAVGDEQTLVSDANKLIYTIYEVAGVDPTDVEVLAASSQTSSTTKTLGTFSDEGSLQIAGYLYGDSGGSPLAQSVGTGWTDDSQHRDLTSDGHPGTIAMHGTSASVVTVTGPAYEWGAVAVAFQGAGCGDEEPLPATGAEIGSVGAEGDADGSNTDFTTPGSSPFVEGTLRVLHDGVDQSEHIATQDGEAGTYSLDYAPSAGSTLRLYYTSA